ncbi:hypothetical protein PIB30_101208 [Stylosanthes scabra]|uniref:Uncharacterized protein n=1 Tax=Stylosanthes scabra TaxID=79078 RepID=A0ABU6VW50_9FABA|nr:hypothetical protein [Stylosanthes scabra]
MSLNSDNEERQANDVKEALDGRKTILYYRDGPEQIRRGMTKQESLSPFKQALVSHAYAYTPRICVQLIHLSQPFHLAQPPLLHTSLTPLRICVAPPHSTHFLSNTPMHMRTTLRICVEFTSKTQPHTTHPRLGVLAYA